jgi:hypothetical protein
MYIFLVIFEEHFETLHKYSCLTDGKKENINDFQWNRMLKYNIASTNGNSYVLRINECLFNVKIIYKKSNVSWPILIKVIQYIGTCIVRFNDLKLDL